MKTPKELVDHIELNFSAPQPQLLALAAQPLAKKERDGGLGQLVVKFMADDLYVHLSDTAWCEKHAGDMGLIWDLLEEHQCLAGDYFGKFKSDLLQPQGRGGGIGTTTTTTGGGCPDW